MEEIYYLRKLERERDFLRSIGCKLSADARQREIDKLKNKSETNHGN